MAEMLLHIINIHHLFNSRVDPLSALLLARTELARGDSRAFEHLSVRGFEDSGIRGVAHSRIGELVEEDMLWCGYGTRKGVI